MDFDDILKEFEIDSGGAGGYQPASSNDPLADFEIPQSNNDWYDNNNGTQNDYDTLADYEYDSNSSSTSRAPETPEYSVQEAAQQANEGQSYLTTAVGNVTGEQQDKDPLSLFEKPEVKTTPERDALIEEYNNLGNPNYLHTKEEREAYIQKHDELLGQLRAMDEQLGNGAMDYNSRDRSQSVLGSAIKGYGADISNSAATVLSGLNELGQKLGGDTGQYSGWATDEVSRAAIPQENDQNVREQQRQEVANMQAKSDKLAQESAEDIARAKNGQSKLAQFGTDIATNAIQMSMDALAAGLTGGSSLAPMFVRSAGGGAREARQEGATTAQQLTYGAVKGGIEAATEKMFDGLAGLYGAGAADEVIEKLIGKLGNGNAGVQTALRVMFSGLGESLEEGASGVADPFAKMIYQGIDSLPKNFNSDMASDTLYSMLVGFAMGGAGGGVNILTGGNRAANEALLESAREANGIDTSTPDVTSPQAEAQGAVSAPTVGQTLSAATPEDTTAEAPDRGVAKSLANNIPQISDMNPVAHLTGNEMSSPGKRISEQIMDFFASFGNKVVRSDLGEVIFDKYGKKGMLAHKPINRAKMVTLTAAPEVVKNGRLIQYTDNWKNRGYASYVYAAPVTVGDSTIYVAAVVNAVAGNKFYLSECVDSNGNYVRINADPSDVQRPVPKNGIPSNSEGSASEVTIPQGEDSVKSETPETGSATQHEMQLDTYGYPTEYRGYTLRKGDYDGDFFIDVFGPGENIAQAQIQMSPFSTKEDYQRRAREYIDSTLDGKKSSQNAPQGSVESQSTGAPPAQESAPTGESQKLNSKSEEGSNENTGGAWVPPTGQPGSKEPKVSQASTNSMRNTAEQNNATQEDLTYIPKSEQESLNNAMNRVAADKVGEMNNLIGKDMWTGEDIDTAMTIYGQLKYDSVNSHDSAAADTWAKIVQEHATRSGQALQAFSKWARTGKAAQLDIDAMLDANEDLSAEEKQQIKEKVQEFSERYDSIKDENDPDALDNLRKLILEQNDYRKTGTFGNKNFEKLLNKETDFNWLKEYAIRQMRNIPADFTEKPSLGQKLKTWQVNSQLTRVGTFIRNLGGNSTFGIVDTLVQNSLGRVIDNVVSTKVGGRREVTLDKSWLSSKAREAAVRAAERSVLEVAGDVDMTGDPNRYGQTSGRTNKMVGNEAQRFMSRWEQLLGYSLTTSDRFFRGQIEQSITESLMERGMAEAEAKEIAKATADYRLFQNNGKAAQLSKTAHDALNKLFSVGKENGEGGFGLGDLLNPYPGVPANLAVKALEYSPLNAIKGFKEITTVINDAKAGKTIPGKQMQAVMDTARGLSGVPIIAMFTALAKSGLFKNSDDEDYDVKAEESAQNLSGIQWNLSATLRALDGEPADWKDGDNIMKVSWLEPLNAFMSIASLFAESNEDRDLESMASIYLSGALQAAMDMPVMENIQNAVNTFKYAQGDDLLQRLGEAGAQLAGDALGGMIPAPISQTARVTDDYVRDTRGNTKAETAYNAFLNSLPGLRNTLPVKTDNFGNARENEPDMYNRFMNSFIRPGAISTFRETAVQDEIGKLYKETGDVALYPDRNGPKSVKVDGIDYPLTAEESRAYHEFVGQKSEEFVQALVDNKAYKILSTEQKTNAVKEMYELARGLAKDAYISENGIKTDTVSDATKLLSGIDKAGTSNDKTPLNESNLANYVVYSEAFKSSLNDNNFKEVDKMAKWYNGMDNNLQTVLLERNTDLKRILEYQKIGLGSETYTKIKNTIPDAQNELDANSTTSSLVRLYGVAKADIPEKDRLNVLENLVQGSNGFIGANAKAAVNTLKSYGLSIEQTAQFFDIALHCATYKDTGDAKDFKGKLTPENTAYALSQIPGMTDAQRSAAYNAIRAQVSNYYNDWGTYTYASEVKWFTNPKNKATYGTNVKISPRGQNALLAAAG